MQCSDRCEVGCEAFRLRRNDKKMSTMIVREIRRFEDIFLLYSLGTFRNNEEVLVVSYLAFRRDLVTNE